MALHLGIYDHLGWAIAVTADDAHEVVDRRRIGLLEAGLPRMPIHHPPAGLSVDGIAALVACVRASAERATSAALDALAASLPGAVASLHLRAVARGVPTDIETLLRAPWHARADAVMYREVLAAAAGSRGWPVAYYDAKTAEAEASALLGARAGAVLRAPRERLGPPWTRDCRIALAATVPQARNGPASTERAAAARASGDR